MQHIIITWQNINTPTISFVYNINQNLKVLKC